MEYKGKVHWRDGREYGTCRRYVMEHAGSAGKVTAAQMWDFCTKCFENNGLGILLAYERMPPPKKISRRMHKLIRDLREKFGYMLVDVPGLSAHIVAFIHMGLIY